MISYFIVFEMSFKIELLESFNTNYFYKSLKINNLPILIRNSKFLSLVSIEEKQDSF
jgi:hypothetical protein